MSAASPQRAQHRIGVDHPGVDHLAGEVQRGRRRPARGRVELGELGPDPLRRPPGRAALGVARLVQQRVQRPAGEAELVHHRVQERVGELVAGERVLQQVVQRVAAVGLAEHGPGRLERPHGQRRAVRQPDLVLVQVVGHPPGHVRVLRVPLVVRGVLGRDGAVGVPVDVVGGRGEPGQPAGDERLPDAVRRERQVGDRAHAAEALPEHAPRLAGQLAPDQLGVEHDAVGAEVGQVVGLGLRARGREPGQGLPVRRGGPAGAALVEQQHPVVLQRPVQPGLPALGPLRAEPGAALQEQQPGQVGVGLVGGDDLAGEHLDLLAVRPLVVERDGEEPVGQHGAGVAEADHGPDAYRPLGAVE